MSREQRRHDRYAIALPVLLTRGKQTLSLITTDVSLSGLFIRTDDPPPLRELLKIELSSPSGGRPLGVTGMAVHSLRPEQASGRPAGVGVQLFGLDPDMKQRWAKLVGEAKDRLKREPPKATPRVDVRVPELKVKPRHLEDLTTAYQRALEKGSLHVATPAKAEPGSRVKLVFVHPLSPKTFGLDGEILARLSTPGFTGFKVKLLDFGPEVQEAFRIFVAAPPAWSQHKTAAS